MDKFAENASNLLTAVIPYMWVLVVGAIFVTGVMFLIGGETREKAKKGIIWIIVGAIVIVGCVYMGKWFFDKIKF